MTPTAPAGPLPVARYRPVAMSVAEQQSGSPSLTAVLMIMTGITRAVLGPLNPVAPAVLVPLLPAVVPPPARLAHP